MIHKKEFYILIAVTILIPAAILIVASSAQGFLNDLVYPLDVNTSINQTRITFTLTNKHFELNESWTSVKGNDYFYMNDSELKNLGFNKEYSCNVTESPISWLNTTLSDCKETIK